MTVAVFGMDIQYQPADSAMQRFIQPQDTFRIYLHRGQLEPIELTGSDVVKILTLHFCQADATLTLARKIAASQPSSARRLLHQHKPLRGL